MAARYLGVNLAWREDRPGLPANETGVAVIDSQGLVLDAGWRRGVAEVLGWAGAVAGAGDALMFVDAPLVVRNETGQRLCETQGAALRPVEGQRQRDQPGLAADRPRRDDPAERFFAQPRQPMAEQASASPRCRVPAGGGVHPWRGVPVAPAGP